MNQKEWKHAVECNIIRDYTFYNKTRKYLKEFKSLGLCDKDAKVIHPTRSACSKVYVNVILR